MKPATEEDQTKTIFMKTTTNSLLRSSTVPLMLLAAMFVGCSGEGDTHDADASSASATTITTDGSGDGTMSDGTSGSRTTTSSGTGDRYDPTGVMDPNGNYNADGSLRTGVILTPVQERTDAMASMKGIRATLMAELTEVRSHLKDGTLDKEHAEADQERAADLAQGLERVDRALEAMGGATDATWNDMRSAQLKEVNEVRTWWNAHMAQRESMARQ